MHPLLDKLPKHMASHGVYFIQECKAAWPLVSKLTASESFYVMKHLYCYNDNQAAKYADTYSKKKYYQKRWAPFVHKHRDKLACPIRHFWIVDAAKGKIVGFRGFYAMNDWSGVETFCHIFPEHRQQGWQTRSAKAAINTVVNTGLLPALYAETELENEWSQRALIKAGFRSCGEGVTAAVGGEHNIFKRFVVGTHQGNWIYPAPCPPN